MEQNQHPPVFNRLAEQNPAPQYQPRVKARPLMEPIEAVTTCLKKFIDFKGRARRSEFWWFVLFVMIVWWVFSSLGMMHAAFSIIGMILSFVLMIPQFAATTRRLHDTGHSGWWAGMMYGLTLVAYCSLAVMLIPHLSELMAEGDQMAMAMIMADAVQENPAAMGVASIAGIIVFLLMIITLVFCVLDSHWTENKYGPSPKYQ